MKVSSYEYFYYNVFETGLRQAVSPTVLSRQDLASLSLARASFEEEPLKKEHMYVYTLYIMCQPLYKFSHTHGYTKRGKTLQM